MFAFFIFQEHTEQMQYGNTSTNRLMVWYERGWDLYFVTTLKKQEDKTCKVGSLYMYMKVLKLFT